MGLSSSLEKLQAMKSESDHKSDCVPVSAIGDASAYMCEGFIDATASPARPGEVYGDWDTRIIS